jgi:CheY-like chemotaxis protein
VHLCQGIGFWTARSNPPTPIVLSGYEATTLIRLNEARQCSHQGTNFLANHVKKGFAASERSEETACKACRVPIVALTADVMKGCRDQCMAVGMDDYLVSLNPIRANEVQLLSSNPHLLDASNIVKLAKPYTFQSRPSKLHNLFSHQGNSNLLDRSCK